jgi:leucyl aminopeptidase
MTPEIKSLTLERTAAIKTDLLVVLLDTSSVQAQSPLGAWVHQAIKAGDLDLSNPGQTLAGYRLPGMAAKKVLLLTTAGKPPSAWRASLHAALQSAKLSQASQACVVLPSGDPASVECALTVVYDASYVYTATKPSANPRRLKSVVLGVPQAQASKAAFERAHARCLGVELAREWGNRPANHATPTHLAKVAQELARHKRVSCEVLGPRQNQGPHGAGGQRHHL